MTRTQCVFRRVICNAAANVSPGSVAPESVQTIRNQDYYDFLRSHPLVLHLRTKLFHVTALANYRSIKRERMIRPNDGTMVGVLQRRAPNLTVCEKLKAISLFDFDQPDDRIFPLSSGTETINDYFVEWGKFLWWYSPVTVILVLDRQAIKQNLIGFEKCAKVRGQWIYNVEICHRGAIPSSAITETILVSGSDEARTTFEVFSRSIVGDLHIARFERHCGVPQTLCASWRNQEVNNE